MGLSNFFDAALKGAKRNSPSILTGLSIASMAAAIIFTIKETPKALKVKEEAEQEKGSKLTPIETVKTVGKYYIPTVAFGTLSALCAWNANKINKKRYAALMTAYSLTETAFKDYREQVKESVGERKEKRICSDLNQKKLDQNPASNTTVVVTGGGEALFYEPLKKLYFTSDLQSVRKVINDLNFRLINTQYISYNDYLEELKLPPLTPRRDGMDGDEIGWSVFRYQLDPDFLLGTSDDDKPCFIIDHEHYPPDSRYRDMF